MGEKRGNTGKLIYDFNTAGVLEVLLKDIWRRTTARDFRSFDGKRRISEPTSVKLGKVDMPMRTYEYDGPTYVYDTNMMIERKNNGQLITSQSWDHGIKMSKSRSL
tara:strand:+ start:385 stop:702 length:318 start_codon:yes stop_codon:yes gene_type:complete